MDLGGQKASDALVSQNADPGIRQRCHRLVGIAGPIVVVAEDSVDAERSAELCQRIRATHGIISRMSNIVAAERDQVRFVRHEHFSRARGVRGRRWTFHVKITQESDGQAIEYLR